LQKSWETKNKMRRYKVVDRGTSKTTDLEGGTTYQFGKTKEVYYEGNSFRDAHFFAQNYSSFYPNHDIIIENKEQLEGLTKIKWFQKGLVRYTGKYRETK